MERLTEYRSDVYSQNGEDGVLEELIRRLGLDKGENSWCVEFGAWDGKHLSNTFLLVESQNWKGIFIEGDPRKFEDLKNTAMSFPSMLTVLCMVGGERGEGRSLDDLLSKTPIPYNYEILSVDIDSSDLDVWSRHLDYRPTIVVIEINSSLMPGILCWHEEGRPGNSFSATLAVARSKGYSLVCHTGNMIFVKNEAMDLIGLDQLDQEFPERLFDSKWVQTRISHPSATLKFYAGWLTKPVKKTMRRILSNRG